MRGGTICGIAESKPSIISIHPPREGWDLCRYFTKYLLQISIHPPREGWDTPDEFSRFISMVVFQSTHPVRGGTNLASAEAASSEISIHPPREGWDSQVEKGLACLTDFNPPTP